MKCVRSNEISLKYQRFTSSGCKDIEIRTLEFVPKTQFLRLRDCSLTKPRFFSTYNGRPDDVSNCVRPNYLPI